MGYGSLPTYTDHEPKEHPLVLNHGIGKYPSGIQHQLEIANPMIIAGGFKWF